MYKRFKKGFLCLHFQSDEEMIELVIEFEKMLDVSVVSFFNI